MTEETKPDELSEDEMRRRVVELAFGGDEGRFHEFCETVRSAVPPDTEIVLRGSAITGVRWKDNAPFDADGPGTSDLDLTLVGDAVHEHYKLTGYYVPGVHSRPLTDDDLEVAPDLIPLRERLVAMVGRPVNIQATRDIVMFLRGDLIGQPYLTLVKRSADTTL